MAPTTTTVRRIAADSVAVILWENETFDLEGLGLPSRVGKQFRLRAEYAHLTEVEATVQFRLRDEDNEIHYRGVCRDDADCDVQDVLSSWGAADTGGFIIEVKRDGVWTMEIG